MTKDEKVMLLVSLMMVIGGLLLRGDVGLYVRGYSSIVIILGVIAGGLIYLGAWKENKAIFLVFGLLACLIGIYEPKTEALQHFELATTRVKLELIIGIMSTIMGGIGMIVGSIRGLLGIKTNLLEEKFEFDSKWILLILIILFFLVGVFL